MKKTLLILSLISAILYFGTSAFAQTITTDPEFPSQDALCTLYFNATGTPLEGYNSDLYTHTGVTADGEQWQYVIGSWGNNTTQPQLTNIGTDMYQLDIAPTIREFYSVPASKEITEMCFVFRSADGGTQSTDLFVDVYSSNLSVVFQQPELSEFIIPLNEPIDVLATSPLADSMFLYVNNEEILAVEGITIEETILADNFGSYWTQQWVKVKAKNETEMVADSFAYVVIPDSPVLELPLGVVDGINYLDESTVILSLYAPLKNFVFVVGDFNEWEVGESAYMNKSPEGDRYWIQLDVTPGEEYAYQYLVDGLFQVGDPYCEKVLDPSNDQYIPNSVYPDLKPYPTGNGEGIVSVFQTNQQEYEWQNESFDPPAVTDLVIYELLLRDFIGQHSFNSLIDTLDYLKNMGVNAIELMPVSEFEGNSSWGYNPNYYFAVDKYYGPKNTFKAFIDVCHEEGIAVIMDVVYNHSFGTSPYVLMYWDAANNRPAEDSPFYNTIPKHDFNVGFDMNHESQATQDYISRALRFWINEFKIDGYRFDLSKGFTQTNTLGNTWQWGQYDQSRIDILTEYKNVIHSENESAFVILEHFAENSEEKVLSQNEMLVWGNMNYNYCEASMGWTSTSDLSWASYQQRGWDDPNLIVYMESHDEERMMYKNVTWGNSSNLNHNVKDTIIALERVPLAASFFFTIPGPKMIWQFGEMGYDYSIDYNGRVGEKPIRWDYYDHYKRKYIYDFYSSLIYLKTNFETFKTTDYDISLGGATKRINLNHSSMNATVIGNFAVETNMINPVFQHTGWWYDYFTGDSINVINVSDEIELGPGKYRIYTDQLLETPQIGTGTSTYYLETGKSSHVYPNPSSGNFTISFNVERAEKVSLTVFNLQGQMIKTIINKKMQTGEYLVNWDAIDDSGNNVPKGTYFMELIIGNQVESQKLILY